jgi:hypothetical protein
VEPEHLVVIDDWRFHTHLHEDSCRCALENPSALLTHIEGCGEAAIDYHGTVQGEAFYGVTLNNVTSARSCTGVFERSTKFSATSETGEIVQVDFDSTHYCAINSENGYQAHTQCLAGIGSVPHLSLQYTSGFEYWDCTGHRYDTSDISAPPLPSHVNSASCVARFE